MVDRVVIRCVLLLKAVLRCDCKRGEADYGSVEHELHLYFDVVSLRKEVDGTVSMALPTPRR